MSDEACVEEPVDEGVRPCVFCHHSVVELGMDPLAAITAGTLTAARLLGVDDRLGSLEAGKTADFVAVDQDPLRDIGSLGRPENVVLVAQAGALRKDLTRL
ncbi:amidohydrolase family protein [Streptomyces olivochromogenes]|nr:amidohydrolase family protein [Streptomyces olivochromogenes]